MDNFKILDTAKEVLDLRILENIYIFKRRRYYYCDCILQFISELDETKHIKLGRFSHCSLDNKCAVLA